MQTSLCNDSNRIALRYNFIVIAMSCGKRCWLRKSFFVPVYEGRLETIGEWLVSKKKGRVRIWRTWRSVVQSLVPSLLSLSLSLSSQPFDATCISR